ncbi:hypothetical protein [Roseiflexus castenholzii]|uniref:hypothetical protein n=1 Tax=Roseiflexus castenholzii TaxID=120962 RepID=UPI0012EE3C02|nr:hypothetical protein [Roseiflexus castenholzii]
MLLRPNFSAFIHQLIERLTQLSTHYSPGSLLCLPTDRAARDALLRLTHAIALAADDTRWAVVRGHSACTCAAANLSDFMGNAEFVGLHTFLLVPALGRAMPCRQPHYQGQCPV